jgi:hypothetical protein
VINKHEQADERPERIEVSLHAALSIDANTEFVVEGASVVRT